MLFELKISDTTERGCIIKSTVYLSERMPTTTPSGTVATRFDQSRCRSRTSDRRPSLFGGLP